MKLHASCVTSDLASVAAAGGNSAVKEVDEAVEEAHTVLVDMCSHACRICDTSHCCSAPAHRAMPFSMQLPCVEKGYKP